MQASVRRAVGFAAVGSLALLAPVAGALTAVPFAVIAVAGRLVTDGPVFEVFARPEDRITGQLNGLVWFAIGATGILLLGFITPLPAVIAAGVVLLVVWGNLGERLACTQHETPIRRAAGFTLGGGTAGMIGVWLMLTPDGPVIDLTTAGFLVATGVLMAAAIREAFDADSDLLVLCLAAAGLWILNPLVGTVGATELLVGLGIAGGVGYASWLLGTAAVTGMLTGVIMALLAIVLGGLAWFAVLLAFFGIGGLSSKYRYEEKRAFGVAEANRGARGSRNVLGNATVAMLALLGYAAAYSGIIAINPIVFLFGFVGSLAAALGDTLSSEIGVLCGPPRLITTFERVEPGTDGGVTIEGVLVGVTGAGIIAVVSMVLFGFGILAGLIILAAGVLGMFADSILGATLEGRLIGNQAVNFLATLVGGLLAATTVLATGVGI